MNAEKNNKVTKDFADRLLDLISESKKPIKQLAKEIGIPSGSLSKYQNAAAEPGIENFFKIADYFKVSTDYLLGFSNVKSFNIEDKSISKKTGLSGESIEILSGLENIRPMKMKINRSEMSEFAQELKKTMDSSEIDEIMGLNIEDDIYFPFMLNKFIEDNDFCNFFSNFGAHVLDKTLLNDYEKWAEEYLDKYLTDDLIEHCIGYTISSYEGINDEKMEAKRQAKKKIKRSMANKLLNYNLDSTDPEILSFIFFKKVQNMIDSITANIENEARNTKFNQLRFMQITREFDEMFKERKF